MTGWTAGRTLPDARYFQIAALGSLLAINFAWIDFGARPLNSALATATLAEMSFIEEASYCSRAGAGTYYSPTRGHGSGLHIRKIK